jgi:hypothetical protein
VKRALASQLGREHVGDVRFAAAGSELDRADGFPVRATPDRERKTRSLLPFSGEPGDHLVVRIRRRAVCSTVQPRNRAASGSRAKCRWAAASSGSHWSKRKNSSTAMTAGSTPRRRPKTFTTSDHDAKAIFRADCANWSRVSPGARWSVRCAGSAIIRAPQAVASRVSQASIAPGSQPVACPHPSASRIVSHTNGSFASTYAWRSTSSRWASSCLSAAYSAARAGCARR